MSDAPIQEPTAPPPPRRNIKLVVAYDGSAYHGWQRQAQGMDTVQERLEYAAARVMGHPVIVFGAGRTDAGVHAAGQVANFFTPNFAIPLKNMRRAINSKLPRDIAVRSANEMPATFQASRSAVGKTYQYRLYVGPDKPVALAGQVHHYWRPLDVTAMQAGARRLLGWHDFRGLASSAEVRDNTVRHVWRCDVAETGNEIHVTVEGNGFLYNMVRNIVGTLMEIGRGQWSPDRIDLILSSRERSLAGPTAPPDGLSLMAVHYRDRLSAFA
jgi:tRNA pseudouridine38-40 synthase